VRNESREPRIIFSETTLGLAEKCLTAIPINQIKPDKKTEKGKFGLSLDLQEEEKAKLLEVLNKHEKVFADSMAQIGRTNLMEYKVKMKTDEPIRRPVYRTSYKEKEIIAAQVK